MYIYIYIYIYIYHNKACSITARNGACNNKKNPVWEPQVHLSTDKGIKVTKAEMKLRDPEQSVQHYTWWISLCYAITWWPSYLRIGYFFRSNYRTLNIVIGNGQKLKGLWPYLTWSCNSTWPCKWRSIIGTVWSLGVAWIPYYRGESSATGLCMSCNCHSCPRSTAD